VYTATSGFFLKKQADVIIPVLKDAIERSDTDCQRLLGHVLIVPDANGIANFVRLPLPQMLWCIENFIRLGLLVGDREKTIFINSIFATPEYRSTSSSFYQIAISDAAKFEMLCNNLNLIGCNPTRITAELNRFIEEPKFAPLLIAMLRRDTALIEALKARGATLNWKTDPRPEERSPSPESEVKTKIAAALIFFGLSFGASSDEVKKAFRRASMKHHPDKNSSANANADMTAINGNYELLRTYGAARPFT
jgi:hypothetical protein